MKKDYLQGISTMEELYERLMDEPAPARWMCQNYENGCKWEGDKYKVVKLRFKNKKEDKMCCPHCGEGIKHTAMYVFWTTAQEMKKNKA
ncbi:hypothetical protein D3C81_665120 [compost metagenome]